MQLNSDTMNRRVMIVESHDGFRHLMGAYLSQEFDVVGAKTGLEAMHWLKKGPVPHAIVMDTRIPELDGIQLLSNLRCSGLYCGIPVVVMGQEEESGDGQQFRVLGASEYIRKPFSPIYLKERLLQITG